MLFDAVNWSVVWTTLKLATITTAILLGIGTPLAWWLAHTRCWCRVFIETLVTLPLVLPPTVLGFYLLILLGPTGFIGNFWQHLAGYHLAFSFAGLVIGSIVFSLPFTVQPLHNAFTTLGARPLEVAATLRASPIDRFFTVVVPLTKSAFFTAITLTFAHTIGEFGVVLMIGGNIPEKTQVLSIAIYEHVEMLEFREAHLLAGGMLLFSFLALVILSSLNRKR